MIKHIQIKKVLGSPSDSEELYFSEATILQEAIPPLNTGLVVDALWWELTHMWAGRPLRPRIPKANTVISLDYTEGERLYTSKSVFNRREQQWKAKTKKTTDSLILYFQENGSIAFWEPCRKQAYTLSENDVWNGNSSFCEGLIRDCALWQITKDEEIFSKFKKLLELLSPPNNNLLPGNLQRISVGDARDYITIQSDVGDIPIVYASKSTQYVVKFSYVLLWAWETHMRMCEHCGQETANEGILLVDDIKYNLSEIIGKRFFNSISVAIEILTGASVKTQVISRPY